MYRATKVDLRQTSYFCKLKQQDVGLFVQDFRHLHQLRNSLFMQLAFMQLDLGCALSPDI